MTPKVGAKHELLFNEPATVLKKKFYFESTVVSHISEGEKNI